MEERGERWDSRPKNTIDDGSTTKATLHADLDDSRAESTLTNDKAFDKVKHSMHFLYHNSVLSELDLFKVIQD